jgi:hypothetical protein
VSRDQENALIVVIGVVGTLQTISALYEWVPGEKFSTAMAAVMLAWSVFFFAWVVQRARHAPHRRVPLRERDEDVEV